ncbi:MAG TPA: DnaJ domain-containing protein [Acidimicrobiia bacterium]|nr:DnaJ domain-containing protein [Acidimicrobiia bacterium]
MRTREWASTDFYAVLGVPPSAGSDEIAAAYRTRAKELHPDSKPGDKAAAERFKEVSAAYRVLAEPDTRREYDRYRRMLPRSSYEGYVPPAAPRVAMRPRPGVTTLVTSRGGARFQLTRRGAKWAVFSGIACIVGGIAFGWLVLALEHHDAQLWDRGRNAVATVVSTAGGARLQFTTPGGRLVNADLPQKTGSGDPVVGERVKIRYDPTDPTDVITDTDTVARDVTLWIVSAKLLICGPILVVFGLIRLRRTGPERPGA